MRQALDAALEDHASEPPEKIRAGGRPSMNEISDLSPPIEGGVMCVDAGLGSGESTWSASWQCS